MTFPLDVLARLAWAQVWQVAVVALAVVAVVRICCRDRPRLAYALWMLVVVKSIVPPVWSSPTGLFSWALAGREAGPREATGEPPGFWPVLSAVGATAEGQALDPDRPRDGAGFALGADPTLVPLAIAATWAAGLALGAAVVVGTRVACSIAARRSRVPADARLAAALADMSRRLGVRRNVRLLVTARPIGPAVFGLVRPTILLPERLLAGTSPEQVELILAHELIHVRRGDLLAGTVQLVAQLVWWFHPLVWWAGREAGRERERCCDEDVVAGVGCGPSLYARTLLAVLAQKGRLRSLVAMPGVRALEITSRRLESIMKYSESSRRNAARTSRLAFAAGAALIIPGTGLTLRAHPPASPPPAPAVVVATLAAQEKAPRAKPAGDAAKKAGREREKAELRRAEDRVRWAERMNEKGYYSKSQLDKDRANLERLRRDRGARADAAAIGAANAAVTLKGVVREKGTGRPVAGIQVGATASTSDGRTPATTLSDDAGRFTLGGLPKAPEYHLLAYPKGGAPYLITGRAVAGPGDEGPVTADLELVRGIPFRVRVLDRETGKPLGGSLVYYPLRPNNPFDRGATGYLWGKHAGLGAFYEAEANDEGQFLGAALPGPGFLGFSHPFRKGDESRADRKPPVFFPDGKKGIELTPNDRVGPFGFVPISADPLRWTGMPLGQFDAVIAIDPRDDADAVTYEIRIAPREATRQDASRQ